LNRTTRWSVVATLSVVWIPVLIIGGILGFPYLAGASFAVRWLSFAAYSFLLVMFGIVVPRILGNRFRETFAFISALPLWLLAVVLYPVTFPMLLICRTIDRRTPSNPKRIAAGIAHLAQSAASEKAISKRQAQLITRAVELSGITAADIMVGRADMHPISDALSLADALIEAHHHHHTRFPLAHNGDLDQIIGYVNFKDIVGALRVNPADPTLHGIKRPIESVGAETPLPELLQLLTRGYQHIVIVRDAQQRTLGMVTLEDLMETLVGDLEDEYDKPPDFIIPLTGNRFRAGGGATFSQLRGKVAPVFPDWDLTINEWISGQAEEKIPEQFSAVFGQCTFTVRKIARGRVFDVIIDRAETSGNPPVKEQQ
jgi:putative hemolysin